MLTPQEVADKAFSKASFGGYNMAMVDEFLDLVTADYTALYKENAALKTKLKVLADKVEEYRATEEAMRRAILSAQMTAQQMVDEAKEQADGIVTNAQKEAEEKLASIHQEVASEQLRLTAAQNATSAYIGKLKELYQNEMEYLSSLSKLSASAPKVDQVAQTADAIGTAVEKAVEEVPPVVEEPKAEEPKAEEPKAGEKEEDGEPTIPMKGKRPGKKAPKEEPREEEPAQLSLEEDSLYQELRRGPVLYHQQPAAEEPKEPKEAEEEEESPAQEEEPTRRIDFGNLKFGKDYEID